MMNSIVGDRYIAELVQIFEQQSPALYTGQHSLCLTVPCLLYIQKKLTNIHEATGSPLPAQFTHLQQLQESFSRIMVLKIITDKQYQLSPTTTLSLEPFRAVHSLILKKIPVTMITGLSHMRSQIRSLVVQRCSLQSMDDVIIKCGGDDSTSFSWASLKEIDFSHNTVSQLGESLQFLTAIEKMDLSNNVITDDSTGIELIDSVTYLHLGFNQLKSVPRFGPRAKFNLTALNLRNNRLATIEGVQELDSLIDLDLTDNLIARHSELEPLQNLHNLCLLSLVGNPLSFHPKHRLKTVEVLSNLINPSSFRLDSKKLSNNEKKAIPRSLTHYPQSSPSLSSGTASQSPLHTHHTLTPPSNSQLMIGISPGHQSDAIVFSKRRRKKPRVVALHDSDEDQDSMNDRSGGAATDTASSVPLKYERRLQKIKDLKKQMPNKWLLSNASLDTTSSESNQMARGASQPRVAQEHPPLGPAAMETVDKETRDSSVQGNGSNKKKAKKNKVTVTTTDTTSSEPRTSTPILASEIDGVCGECFLVERYESDVEDEGDHILLALSDRFLEEKDTNGVTLDRMDLGCLMTAEIQRKPWKAAQESEVVTLQFSNERRDRRKREYVMIEENHDSIISILAPISEENRKAFSLASKVECFTCQRVFDATESKLMPLMKDSQLSPPSQSHSLGSHQRTSLANRFCPFCKSQRLQYTTNAPVFNPVTKLSTSTSPRAAVTHDDHTSSVDDTATYTSNVKAGFVVEGDAESTNKVSNPLADRRNHKVEATSIGEWDSLENAQSYDAVPHQDTPNDMKGNSEYLTPLQSEQQYSNLSWSFGELSGNQAPQTIRSSHDVLYHSGTREQGSVNDLRHDTRDTEESSRSYTQDTSDLRYDTRQADRSRFDTNATKQTIHGGDSGVKSCEVSELSRSGGKSNRLTNSEPTPKLSHGMHTHGVNTQTDRGLRRYYSVEQPQFKPQNHFDIGDMLLHNRSTESVPSLSRMKLPRASLGSVQEQPTSNSLNPFNESCSTNPFDGDESITSNPFGTEEDDHEGAKKEEGMDGGREREGELEEGGWWSHVNPKDRAHSFSKNEERYFNDFQSQSKPKDGQQNEDHIDYDVPLHQGSQHAHPSSSVPATSYMTALGSRITYGKESHNYHTKSKKSSTLPQGKSSRAVKQNGSSKKSTTIPRGKPPLYGLVRGKSMESLDRISPKNERHPIKSNRVVSPFSRKKLLNPFNNGCSSPGIDEGGDSTSPSLHNGSSGSGKSTPEMIKRGHSSSDTLSAGKGSRKKLYRVTSVGDIRYTAYGSDEKGSGYTSLEREGRRIRSSADDRRTSSHGSRESGGGSSSGGGGSRVKLSMSGGSSGGHDGHHKVHKLSSSESSGRPLSTSVLIKDEDPSYIHNSLNLHLDLEVFSKDKGEHFTMIFKAPMVRYNSTKEVPVVAIFSNLNTFIYRITAPQSSQPDKWLSLKHTLPLSKLVYLDVGPFHQFLRLEYSIPGACLTFLLRDKKKCRECLTRLSLTVSDCPKSTFKSVGICSFRLETITHPDRALREAIMYHYNNIKTGSRDHREEEDEVKFYMLAYRHIQMPGKKHSKTPVTVVIANDFIYMGRENFHHWPLPRLQELPSKESLEPPFSAVECKDITDIEQITMDPDQTSQVVLQFFKETLSEGDSKYWSLTTELDSHVQQLVKAVQTPWENMFKVTLPVKYK